jgi:hypothetical protein
MKILTRTLTAVLCLFAAIACYVFGAPVGGVIFIVLGVMFEGLFWAGLFGQRKNPAD